MTFCLFFWLLAETLFAAYQIHLGDALAIHDALHESSAVLCFAWMLWIYRKFSA